MAPLLALLITIVSALVVIFGFSRDMDWLAFVGFVGVTVGILIDTFVVRSMLVPAATMLLGKWAFWPRPPGACRDDTTVPVVSGPATMDVTTVAPERERELVVR